MNSLSSISFDSLSKLKLSELKKKCKELKITKYSKLNKQDIINIIKNKIIQNNNKLACQTNNKTCNICFENKRHMYIPCICNGILCEDCYMNVDKCPFCRRKLDYTQSDEEDEYHYLMSRFNNNNK